MKPSSKLSSEERPPAKWLKANQGWVPLLGQQREPSASVARGLPRSMFPLKTPKSPSSKASFTINHGFYSGPRPPPDRFFAPSSRPLGSPRILQAEQQTRTSSYFPLPPFETSTPPRLDGISPCNLIANPEFPRYSHPRLFRYPAAAPQRGPSSL